MHDTLPLLQPGSFPAIRRKALDTLQANLGYRCNQACLHCHVNAGPNRTEQMDRANIDGLLDFVGRSGLARLDLTGGAPELNPHFRYLVEEARALGVHVIDRCNLTVLLTEGQSDLSGFLADRQVEIVASMPCYLEENVDSQRGQGVYAGSIEALQRLNRLGYGQPGSGLVLNLVYNPLGPALPPAQGPLEEDYRRRLLEDHGIVFTSLLTLANMPIKRFGSTLVSRGEFAGYLDLLKDAHCAANLENVMCRSLISVDWQGYVYDCDFNQMLGLPVRGGDGQAVHLSALDADLLDGGDIVVADHCYGCTAGQGSSCGGALSA